MNYSKAYDKIIAAYFKDEIKPLEAKFCFCGTLCDNKSGWNNNSLLGIHIDFMHYKGTEYARMERALFDGMWAVPNFSNTSHPLYEEALFEGMCAAIEVLKSIHIERGEIIDEGLTLTKRNKNLAELTV